MACSRLRPVDLLGAQGFADAVGYRQAAGDGIDDGELRTMARISGLARRRRLKPTESSRWLAEWRRASGNLQVLVGVQTGGIFEMAVAQGARFAQQGDDFFLRGNQVHRSVVPHVR